MADSTNILARETSRPNTPATGLRPRTPPSRPRRWASECSKQRPYTPGVGALLAASGWGGDYRIVGAVFTRPATVAHDLAIGSWLGPTWSACRAAPAPAR